jgi:hypothetical protein
MGNDDNDLPGLTLFDGIFGGGYDDLVQLFGGAVGGTRWCGNPFGNPAAVTGLCESGNAAGERQQKENPFFADHYS